MKPPSERFECVAFARWLSRQNALLFSHLPLETRTDPITAALNKSMGVRRGVPDYLIVHQLTGRVLFIEMKGTGRFNISEDQHTWLAALSCGGELRGFITRGFKAAQAAVLEYYAKEGTTYAAARATVRGSETRTKRKRKATSR